MQATSASTNWGCHETIRLDIICNPLTVSRIVALLFRREWERRALSNPHTGGWPPSENWALRASVRSTSVQMQRNRGAEIVALRYLAKPNSGRLYGANCRKWRVNLYAERCRICGSWVAPPMCNWARRALFSGVVAANRHQIGRHRRINIGRKS